VVSTLTGGRDKGIRIELGAWVAREEHGAASFGRCREARLARRGCGILVVAGYGEGRLGGLVSWRLRTEAGTAHGILLVVGGERGHDDGGMEGGDVWACLLCR